MPKDVPVPADLETTVGGHPLVARTLARRGLTDPAAARAFLDPQHYRPAPPWDLPTMDAAVERLNGAIHKGESICVWGDFDVDGQTSTTILVSTLRALGAEVRFHIPNRKRESHGVNLPVLERLVAEGIDLLLTCDTGVTAHEATAYARSQGVTVVITDHHDLPPTLPEAHAVVNPKMLPTTHPLRELPGVGCAYKVAEALYERAGRPEEAARFLDLAALGIVADVAVQTGDTRYLLQRGLQALRRTKRTGLQAVMESAEIAPEWLTEEHIGFELAPRLNALGRLDDASVAVELLTTDDLTRARTLAGQLEGLNAQRKLLVRQVEQAAEDQIAHDPSLLEQGALVLSHPSWPGGIIGIVAGRLAERYHKPTVLITTPPGESAHGSARSVEGCNITDAIGAQAGMLHRFGGHPMAAGLSIDAERIPEFRRALSRTVLKTCGENAEATLQIDGALSLSDLSLELVEEIERLAPFGSGNPPLTLASTGLSLVSHTTLGRTGEHLRVTVKDEAGATQKVLWWRGAGERLPEGRFDLAYAVRASNFRGQRDVQVEWIDARPIEEPAAVLRPAAPEIAVVDHRQAARPRSVLAELCAQEDVLVWAEAEDKARVAGRDRRELAPAEGLAIWTTPPGPGELAAAVKAVRPRRVYLFGIDPQPRTDESKAFLSRLLGLVKHELEANDGRVSVCKLAAATAQREVTVRAGLAWLAGMGTVTVVEEAGDEIQLSAGDRAPGGDLAQAKARLKALLEETRAYRAHFAHAEPASLV